MYKFAITLVSLCALSIRAQNADQEEGTQFFLDCKGSSLENELNGPSDPAYFESVTLDDCAPPATSYRKILEKNNILVEKKLILSLRSSTQFGANLLSDLPASVDTLRLRGLDDVLHLGPEVLSSLQNVKDLSLHYVHADKIPENVETLQLSYTGDRVIPSGARNVKSLQVVSSDPVKIEGVMPNLQILAVSAPVSTLLQYDAKNSTLTAPNLDVIQLGSYFPALEATTLSLPEAYKTIISVHLVEVDWTEVPGFLLRGGSNVLYFTSLGNKFTTLPKELFTHTPNLENIEITENRIQFLPKELFVGLNNLNTVKLERNLLTASVLDAIAPVKSLRELYLDGNPLGDLCDNGGSVLLDLKELETLSLQETNATKICSGWIGKIPKLTNLLLEQNDIARVSCSDLVGPVLEETESLCVMLARNAIKNVDCSKEDFDRAVSQSRDLKKVYVQIKSNLTCDRGSYWFSKFLDQEIYVYITPEPVGDLQCHDEWAEYQGGTSVVEQATPMVTNDGNRKETAYGIDREPVNGNGKETVHGNDKELVDRNLIDTVDGNQMETAERNRVATTEPETVLTMYDKYSYCGPKLNAAWATFCEMPYKGINPDYLMDQPVIQEQEKECCYRPCFVAELLTFCSRSSD